MPRFQPKRLPHCGLGTQYGRPLRREPVLSPVYSSLLLTPINSQRMLLVDLSVVLPSLTMVGFRAEARNLGARAGLVLPEPAPPSKFKGSEEKDVPLVDRKDVSREIENTIWNDAIEEAASKIKYQHGDESGARMILHLKRSKPL